MISANLVPNTSRAASAALCASFLFSVDAILLLCVKLQPENQVYSVKTEIDSLNPPGQLLQSLPSPRIDNNLSIRPRHGKCLNHLARQYHSLCQVVLEQWDKRYEDPILNEDFHVRISFACEIFGNFECRGKNYEIVQTVLRIRFSSNTVKNECLTANLRH
jgi:hypothetical protein